MKMKESILLNRKDYDSDEEYYFHYWCLRVQEAGYIDKIIYHPEPIPLTNQVNFTYKEVLKTKENIKTNELLKPHVYKTDFVIYWNSNGKKIFYQLEEDIDLKLSEVCLIANKNRYGNIISIIDTKGSFNGKFNNSAVTFPLNQKWVYDKYKLYVNKVIPYNSRSIKNCFFTDTFTPDEYWYRPMVNQKGKFLKVNCIPRTIDKFINKRKELINKTLF